MVKKINQPEHEERTEEEKLTQAPVMVILGGKEYPIRPLVIKESREWRKQAIHLIAALPELLKITMDDPENFGETLTTMMVTKPDEVIDLFFAYAKDLDREEIESTATDAEMAIAFQEVIKLGFPLAESPLKMMARLSQ